MLSEVLWSAFGTSQKSFGDYIGNQVINESPIELVNIDAIIDLGIEVDIDLFISNTETNIHQNDYQSNLSGSMFLYGLSLGGISKRNRGSS
jgi:hypothetical protein